MLLLNVTDRVSDRNSHRKRALILIQLVALGALPCSISGALAQSGGAPSVGPTPRIEQTDDRTTSERDAYKPLGIKLGSFLLFPTLEADESFNDNIYATSAATGRTASFVQLL